MSKSSSYRENNEDEVRKVIVWEVGIYRGDGGDGDNVALTLNQKDGEIKFLVFFFNLFSSSGVDFVVGEKSFLFNYYVYN